MIHIIELRTKTAAFPLWIYYLMLPIVRRIALCARAGPLERESEKKTFGEEHKGHRLGCDQSAVLEESSTMTRIRELRSA
ncbi:hypothetical protein U1Q18_044822 [Sarracenia purpurea var. burkii]